MTKYKDLKEQQGHVKNRVLSYDLRRPSAKVHKLKALDLLEQN